MVLMDKVGTIGHIHVNFSLPIFNKLDNSFHTTDIVHPHKQVIDTSVFVCVGLHQKLFRFVQSSVTGWVLVDKFGLIILF